MPQTTREQLERACSLHPSERSRLEEAAESAFALESALLARAFDRALAGVLEARTPAEASRRIDTMERVLGRRGESAWLARFDAVLRRSMRTAALVLAGVALVAFAVAGVATLLE